MKKEDVENIEKLIIAYIAMIHSSQDGKKDSEAHIEMLKEKFSKE